jgi:hypothetical protein
MYVTNLMYTRECDFQPTLLRGSDSNESAEREIALWFGGDKELMDWEPTMTPWVRE